MVCQHYFEVQGVLFTKTSSVLVLRHLLGDHAYTVLT